MPFEIEWSKWVFYSGILGSGAFAVGYWIGTMSKRRESDSSTKKNVVLKSFKKTDNEMHKVLQYCLDHSTPLHPVQEKLIRETLKHPGVNMMGAPEVVMLNANIIRALGAKKVLDIGVFTGASSLAAALALSDEGRIVACDVEEEFTDLAKTFWEEAGVSHKIELVIAPAMETLQDLLSTKQSETFDFAFVDADKPNYLNYYEACINLLRKGGVLVIDNTLWSGKVIDEEIQDDDTRGIRVVNERVVKDDRVCAVQLNVGDGITVIVKTNSGKEN